MNFPKQVIEDAFKIADELEGLQSPNKVCVLSVILLAQMKTSKICLL